MNYSGLRTASLRSLFAGAYAVRCEICPRTRKKDASD